MDREVDGLKKITESEIEARLKRAIRQEERIKLWITFAACVGSIAAVWGICKVMINVFVTFNN